MEKNGAPIEEGVIPDADMDDDMMSSGDDSSFEIGARATGGLMWHRSGGAEFAVELSLGFADVHDAQIVALWNFGK